MKYGILFSALMFPAVAQAALIDFAPESGRFTDLGTDDGFYATGSWREDGYDVGFEYENILGGGLGGVAQDFNDGPGLNDSGCCFGEFTYLTFDRPDGKPFSLREIDIDGTTPSYYAEVQFTPYASDGSLDSDRRVYQEVDVAPDNLFFRGIKSDGTEVEARANSFFNSDFLGSTGGPDQQLSEPRSFSPDRRTGRDAQQSRLALLADRRRHNCLLPRGPLPVRLARSERHRADLSEHQRRGRHPLLRRVRTMLPERAERQ